jgi:[pyruvate, water dikinase]-phosphate phosphotransferase / [pyruvate, water dikinase] kinase
MRSAAAPEDLSTVCPQAVKDAVVDSRRRNVFHMHLISDATGETLNAVARAAAAYYADYQPIEHIYALVRTPKQLERVFSEIERQPGIVLFTLADGALRSQLEDGCREFGIPYISILDPVISSLETYLNAKSRPQVGGQHALNDEYFRRIDALNYSLLHDDGQHPEDLESADVVLVGVSRSSKTPTSIYLAIRGFKTANVPLVPGIALNSQLLTAERPLIVGLTASADRIAHMRQNRLISLSASSSIGYADRQAITAELVHAREICSARDWPMIDVTRRSIEETAAEIINLLTERRGAMAQ